MKQTIIMVIISLMMMPANSHGSVQKSVYILGDISDTSPFVRFRHIAGKSSKFVHNLLCDIAPGSNISFFTIGEYNYEKNSISISRTILNRKGYRAQDVRLIMKKIIKSLPTLVETGKLKIQKETAIIAALKTLSQRLDLGKPNVIIILSDMLEYSHEANAYRLIKQKNNHFPKPKHGFLKGVEVYALGAGIGVQNSYENERLEKLWREYFTEAGVSRFIYLTDI